LSSYFVGYICLTIIRMKIYWGIFGWLLTIEGYMVNGDYIFVAILMKWPNITEFRDVFLLLKRQLINNVIFNPNWYGYHTHTLSSSPYVLINK
jgi:hypothetical protein